MNNNQPPLFDLNEVMERQPFFGRKCKVCKRIIRLEYRSGKAFHYCAISPSARTANGKKKIKANQAACLMFKEEDNGK